MKRLILLVLIVGLMTTGSAYAASNATQGNYSGPGGVVSNIDPSHSTHNFSSASPSSKGSLPFTGFDIVLLALGGAGLVGVGMGVRRLSRPLA